MAHKRVKLDPEIFSCSICLDLPKNPVTIPCGHSYCNKCVKRVRDEKESCPRCRQTATPTRVLEGNAVCDVPAAAQTVDWQRAREVSREEIQQGIRSRGKDIQVLQVELENIDRAADKAAEDSEEVFTELIRLMEKRRSDVTHLVRSQQKTEVSRVKAFEEKLKQEIRVLKKKHTELEKLSSTEDHEQFLQKYPSFASLSESAKLPSTKIHPGRYVRHLTVALSEVRDILQDVLTDKCTNTEGDPQPEPYTRAGFLDYSRKITLDPNTANVQLLLSEDNSRATLLEAEQSYSSHPDRFMKWLQVLSGDCLTGRCYWEVEWTRKRVAVAVSYKNISRTGTLHDCAFGFNDKSWALQCNSSSFYKFIHNSIKTPVWGPWSSRVGVYLDHSAGILAFYSVSETMTLIHRIQTTFTEPLYAGLWLNGAKGATAQFCEPKNQSHV